MGVVHKAMMHYYKFYTDKRGLMNIEQFMKFSREFDIFPTLIGKTKLCSIFQSLAGVRAQAAQNEACKHSLLWNRKFIILAIQQSNILNGSLEKSRSKSKSKSKEINEDLIDEHMFVEALAVIALEIPYLNPQPSEVQKVRAFGFPYGIITIRSLTYSKNWIALKVLQLWEENSDLPGK